MSIKKPDGPELEDVFFIQSAFIDTQVLPVSGIYTILVDPADSSTANVTLTLYNVPADHHAATLSAGFGGFGLGHAVMTGTPRPNGYITIEGVTGQRLSLDLGNVTLNGNELKLDKDQQRRLHDEISGENLTYHEILELARTMFNK